MAHAEHPLIAAHGTDAAADLVRQRLNAEPIIGGGQRRWKWRRWARPLPGTPRNTLIASSKRRCNKWARPWKGMNPAQVDAGLQRQMKAVNRVKKEKRADPFVKILASAPERLQIPAFHQQLFQRSAAAEGVQRLVAARGVRRVIMLRKRGHGSYRHSPLARPASPPVWKALQRSLRRRPGPVALSTNRISARCRSGGHAIPGPDTALPASSLSAAVRATPLRALSPFRQGGA